LLNSCGNIQKTTIWIHSELHFTGISKDIQWTSRTRTITKVLKYVSMLVAMSTKVLGCRSFRGTRISVLKIYKTTTF